MSVGSLFATVALDEPTRVYCGSDEPVTGRVLIKYTPNYGNNDGHGVDLFGPMQVMVTFHGRAKSKVWKSNGQTTRIYRGRVPLFIRKHKIYDESFRATPGQTVAIPFTLTFPESCQGLLYDDFNPDPRFDDNPKQPLPPSWSMAYRGFANHYESFIEYRVGTTVYMPNIKVNVTTPGKYQEAIVLYERPRCPPSSVDPRPTTRMGHGRVSNELLLPEADRPKGFRQKAKAAFSSDAYPTYAWTWTCDVPTVAHIGQPIRLRIAARPNDKLCTAILVPDIFLRDVRVDMERHTNVRAEKQLFSCPGASSSTPVWCCRFPALDERSPLEKANDWSREYCTSPLHSIGSSFRTLNVAQRYTFLVSMTFVVADKAFTEKTQVVLDVRPPLSGELGPPSEIEHVEAGPSTGQSVTIQGDAEEGLPQYERPPGYDDAGSDTLASSIARKAAAMKA